jgi:uncharacterized protein
VTTLDIIIITTAVAAGAAVQGTLGFGLGLVAAPVAALVDTRLVPGPMLFIGVPLTVLVALRERGELDWKGIRWALVGRVAGTVVGVLAVANLPESQLIVVFASAIIAAVVLSIAGWRLRPEPGTLMSAGLASGFMGTVTSIGGPPMALVYQRETGAKLRSTLAAYFMVGAAFSLFLLAAAGEFGRVELRLGLLLLPGMAAGFLLSRPLARWLDRGYTRFAVLTFAVVSSVTLLVRELL